MLYMIVGRDAEDSLSRRAAARESHLARINVLLDEGRLVLAGPLPRIDAADPGPAGFQVHLRTGHPSKQRRQSQSINPY
ncbi:MAG: YciI family protein [Desulfovermiculus sp.]